MNAVGLVELGYAAHAFEQKRNEHQVIFDCAPLYRPGPRNRFIRSEQASDDLFRAEKLVNAQLVEARL